MNMHSISKSWCLRMTLFGVFDQFIFDPSKKKHASWNLSFISAGFNNAASCNRGKNHTIKKRFFVCIWSNERNENVWRRPDITSNVIFRRFVRFRATCAARRSVWIFGRNEWNIWATFFPHKHFENYFVTVSAVAIVTSFVLWGVISVVTLKSEGLFVLLKGTSGSHDNP